MHGVWGSGFPVREKGCSRGVKLPAGGQWEMQSHLAGPHWPGGAAEAGTWRAGLSGPPPTQAETTGSDVPREGDSELTTARVAARPRGQD